MTEFFPITNPVIVFALVASLILLCPLLLARYRLPGMLGLLFAGALLGPNALHVLARDQSFILFGTVGLLYIMFIAALEIDMQQLKRSKSHTLLFGLLTFAIPQATGTAIALLLGFDWLAAILLASMFASHTLLAYPITSRLGISRNPAVTTAVGGTIITDTLALLVLAVIATMAKGELSEHYWLQLGVSLSLYILVILLLLPKLARWFFRSVGGDGVAEFVFVLAMVFICASFSHLAGAEPIIGAFLAGLALNRIIPHHSTLMNRLQFTGEAIFIPFFLLSVGMLLDVSIFLASPRAWVVALAMVGTVILTKWAAAELCRLLLGYSRPQARVLFGLSVAQAAATLAATMVGYEIGLFDEAVVNGAILMILVTCFLAPWLVDRYGRKIALTQQQQPEESSTEQRIMVALSPEQAAESFLQLAKWLRQPGSLQPVYPMTIVEERNSQEVKLKSAEQLLAAAVNYLAAADIPAQAKTRIDLNISDGILRARRELRATEVIVGWSEHSSASELLFGSMLSRLLADRSYTLLVKRQVAPLQHGRKLCWLLPPNAELEAGFAEAIVLIKRLCQQLGLTLQVYCQQEQQARLKPRFKTLPEPEWQLAADWLQLPEQLQQQTPAGDLLVLYGVRKGGLAWTPALPDLQNQLASQFPATNLLVIYPAEIQDTSLTLPAA
ncbi:Kef-type K+ transport system, membrane component KefB [Rheinheimera pacifica]|uniref:Kef-type K+ transport system, membrane component KefB n=1 Tax=Rheinheimera pacifica TaxID=173990 RepID=A0A1H6J3N8_9GAMM|nr:cation:proton antiporter [Rheinheimera pacifica]SEH56237.1 Kef-type K+ transport system, membrane component KefB [Rheinheimera pacifica]